MEPASASGPSKAKSGKRSKKTLGLFAVFSISAGAMISSGLFVLPGLAFEKAGPAVIVCYALALVFVLPVMFAKAELATAMPRSGGNYFFIERSLGSLAGTVAGLADWLSISLKTAFALVGLGALATVIFPGLASNPEAADFWIRVCACGAGILFTVINIVSTKSSGNLQVAMVIGLLAILVLYVGMTAPEVDTGRVFDDFAPKGFHSIFAVAGLVFISFGGLTKVAAVAGEVEQPTRNLPLGMFLAAAIVGALYILVVFTTVGGVAAERLAGSLTPLDLGAENVGTWLIWLVDGAAFLAFATTANAGILAASRAPMAMSRDGLMPEPLSRMSPRFDTPVHSVTITGLFIVAMLTFLSIEDVVKMASTMVLLMFILVNLALVTLRFSGLENYRPSYKSPLAPWPQIAASVVYAFLLFEMGTTTLLMTAGFILLALIWYAAYVRPRVDRQSALVYLVKRLVAPEVARPELEQELKHLALERDKVELDRFDHLVDRAAILDLEGPIGVDVMFEKVAKVLAERLGRDAKSIEAALRKREAESSTVVRPGVAIPHIILPGEKTFDLVLVRCKEGVKFSEVQAPNRKIFVLAGTEDERNLHLRCLMHIASIVEEPGFRDRWLAARGPEGLRDLMHLSKRRRDLPSGRMDGVGAAPEAPAEEAEEADAPSDDAGEDPAARA